MKGEGAARRRLFAVQGAWNYERMLGVGMGYAARPLLEDLRGADPERFAEASARSAEFFNCHPYLAGLALGATVRAEYDRVPGDQIARLRAALCSPLGALGDQLFWAGTLPAMLGAALAAIAFGARWYAVVAFLVVFNAVRLYVARWTLAAGLQAGMRVGNAIGASRLPRLVALAGPAAGFAVGVATPLIGRWLLSPFGSRAVFGTVLLAAAGLAASRLAGPRYSAPRFTLIAMGGAVLLRWILS
ncbi:MAG TPA: PTS system mannose/fructose/sorbose family transporter subunit IID [Gemmatimonadales bacterium]|nr:PTS system mannose/fructose/sorbose family transporter subunit IID [Gemmatimonadales bacterium]